MNDDNFLPCSLSDVDETDRSMHFHDCPEILFVLDGGAHISYRNHLHDLSSGDLIYIHPYEFHTCMSDGGRVLCIRLYPGRLGAYAKIYLDHVYDCCSLTAEPEALRTLRHAVLRLVQTSNTPSSFIENILCANIILNELEQHFKISYTDAQQKTQLDRIKPALIYIQNHYLDKLSLKDAAEAASCTPTYFSKLFKTTMGISFSGYLMELRLSSAWHALVYTREPIEKIAFDNGFANAPAFSRAFKAKYHCPPGTCRKQFKEQSERSTDAAKTKMQPAPALHFTESANTAAEIPTPQLTAAITQVESGHLDVHTARSSLLSRIFQKIFPLCDLNMLLYSKNQALIADFQEKCAFEYIYLRGIFQSELGIYTHFPGNRPIFNFERLDSVLDFVLSLHLKPIIDLGSMPKELADEGKFINFFEYTLGRPKDDHAWEQLIIETIRHIQSTYGRKTVEEWLFYTWISPVNPVLDVFGIEQKNFFEFYEKTYKAVKKCNAHLNFGSVQMDIEDIDRPEYVQWYVDFSEYCRSNDCEPAFIQAAWYPEQRQSKNGRLQHIPEKDISVRWDNFQKLLVRLGWNRQPLYLHEYGVTRSRKAYINDRIEAAAGIAQTLLQLSNYVDGCCYCSFMDHPLTQFQLTQIFYGSNGLVTYNGIKKGAYKVFRLFTDLGHKVLFLTHNSIVTTDGERILGVLCNYNAPGEYGSDQLQLSDTYGILPAGQERYQKNPDSTAGMCRRFEFTLTGLDSSQYLLTEYILDAENGCAWHKWHSLGDYPGINQEDVRYINRINTARILHSDVSAANHTIRYIRTLQPNEVRRFELIPTL